MHLIELQAVADSIAVPCCGHPRLPLAAPPASRPAPSPARMSIHRGSLIDQLEPLSCNLLRELVDLAHQRFLGLSHLMNSPIVRLGQSFRARPFLLDISNRILPADQHASAFLIPRYGQIDKPESFPQKVRRRWGDSF